MTDHNPISLKEQLEQIIAIVLGAWIQQRGPDNNDPKEEIIKRFCNFSIHELHGFLDNEYLNIQEAGTSALFTAEMISKSLESVKILRPPESDLKDLSIKKTPAMEWLMQQKREGRLVSVRLINVFKVNRHTLKYIEDISEPLFFTYSNMGRKTWEEFVALRGY